MRPPDCYVCHLTLHEVPDDGRDYFTLVRFGATEDAKMAPGRAMEAVGRTGHPRNAIWFCNKDLPLAREYENRDLDDALDAIETRGLRGHLPWLQHPLRLRGGAAPVPRPR